MTLEILWRGGDLVAIMKPAGLAAIPGRAEARSALDVLAAQLGLPCTGTADPRVRVVHRLDKDTSGVMLWALTSAAQRWVSGQFQDNTVAKEYLAIVAAAPAVDEGTVDAPIGPHPHNKAVMCVTTTGRAAVTAWRVDQRLAGRRFALVRAFPRTGRTHQIRVHLRYAGMPLAVDPVYNADAPPLLLSKLKRGYRPAGGEEKPLISRLTLHAHRLTFTTPQGERVTVEAELPKDFRAAANQLAKLR